MDHLHLPLTDVLARLRRRHGSPERLEPAGAFEMILFENASYLVPDETRAAVFARLARTVGTTPAAILAARPRAIERAIAEGGMLAAHRVEKIRSAARLAVDAPLDEAVKSDLATALRVLKKFPSIGAPGAEKIALFAGGHRVLPLDSNGLRVLTRLGFATEQKTYDRTYRAAKDAIADDIPRTVAGLVSAHLLLRAHGKQTCTRTRPSCGACMLADECPSAAGR